MFFSASQAESLIRQHMVTHSSILLHEQSIIKHLGPGAWLDCYLVAIGRSSSVLSLGVGCRSLLPSHWDRLKCCRSYCFAIFSDGCCYCNTHLHHAVFPECLGSMKGMSAALLVCKAIEWPQNYLLSLFCTIS